MLASLRSPIAALLVLTIFSTAFGRSLDCSVSCQAQGCLAPGKASVTISKTCCGGCGTAAGCQCKKSTSTAKKSCCEKQSKAMVAKSCCVPKQSVGDSPVKQTCSADCPCARQAEFPPLPLDQSAKVAETLKLPVIAYNSLLAVLPAPTYSTLGQISPDDSPPPRAGLALRIWMCSWTT
jgi:hypothetical protein